MIKLISRKGICLADKSEILVLNDTGAPKYEVNLIQFNLKKKSHFIFIEMGFVIYYTVAITGNGI